MSDPRAATDRVEAIAREWRAHLTYHVDHGAVSPEWTCQLTYIGVARHPDGKLRPEPANWYATGATLLGAAADLLDQIGKWREYAELRDDLTPADPPGDTP
jgi:hypothetical protein